MNVRSFAGCATVVACTVVLSAACGSESENSDKGYVWPDAQTGFDANSEWLTDTGTAIDAASPQDGATTDADGGSGDASVVDGGGGPGPVQNCSSATSQVDRSVNLVVMLDTSASLGNGPDGGDNTATRWTPVTTALKAFFSDADSAGLKAALHVFPIRSGSASVCDANAYTRPLVGLTALPSTSLGSSINALTPNGGSPMFPAAQGAVSAAKSIAAAHPSEKTAIVFVTDGGPNDCESTYDKVRQVATEAFQGAPSIPTYVVAVGPETTSLDQVASSGGTQSAVVVSPADPAKASDDLLAKLDSFRKPSCSPSLPSQMPGGGTIDYDAVRVNYTAGSGVPATLPYSEACTASNGWHYDNKAAPTKIELCATSCQAYQNDRRSRLTIAFNCKNGGDGGVIH